MNLLYDSGYSQQGSASTYRGGVGREVGGRFRWGGDMDKLMADSCGRLVETNATVKQLSFD